MSKLIKSGLIWLLAATVISFSIISCTKDNKEEASFNKTEESTMNVDKGFSSPNCIPTLEWKHYTLTATSSNIYYINYIPSITSTCTMSYGCGFIDIKKTTNDNTFDCYMPNDNSHYYEATVLPSCNYIKVISHGNPDQYQEHTIDIRVKRIEGGVEYISLWSGITLHIYPNESLPMEHGIPPCWIAL